MFCMDVFLHKLVYEGIKRSEWKNFLREGEDMKKFGKKIKSGYWGDWDDLLTEAENKTEM